MTGQVDLWDDRDVAFCRIGDDLLHLLLRVETLVRFAIILATVATDHGLLTLRTDLGQLRILLDLDAPALILAQVPVHPVHVMQCQHVDELLHRIRRDVMTTHIEHHTSIAKAGRIVNCRSRQRHIRSLRIRRDGLTQRLDTIEYTRWCSTRNRDLTAIHLHPIAFWIVNRAIQGQDNAFALTLSGRESEASQLLHIIGEELRIGSHLAVPCWIIDLHGAVQHKSASLRHRHLLWQRYHLIIALHGVSRASHEPSRQCQAP